MTCTNQNRQEEGTQRSEESDAIRMLAQQLLGNLNQPIHTARCLHDACTGNGCDDDVNHIRWRSTWFQPKTEHENSQTDTGNGTKGKRTIA